ncbi:hypothetical protein NM688_g3470 [Phlebia brevispora]|uniref:Uncharacterized protein n=1 Tax=Phlebia brevispora TaxID=194682 RepID=A0ACC1T5N7_9APHY|nr:hypothetical protein NM688_g3470 [Phlebia brevispora]
MPKRKYDLSSEEEEEAVETGNESEENEPLKAPPKPKGVKTAKKPVIKNDSDEEEDRPAKKKKPESTSSKKKAATEEAGAVLVDASGDKYVDLGKKKRATVRAFKGTTYVDIREFYDAGGEEKPGKKGISLTQEQWNTLKTNMDIIDTLVAKVQKK